MLTHEQCINVSWCYPSTNNLWLVNSLKVYINNARLLNSINTKLHFFDNF